MGWGGWRKDEGGAATVHAATTPRPRSTNLNPKNQHTTRNNVKQQPQFTAINYIDRTNLALASVELTAALGLTPATYGLGASLFFVTYFLFQVPRCARSIESHLDWVKEEVGRAGWVTQFVYVGMRRAICYGALPSLRLCPSPSLS